MKTITVFEITKNTDGVEGRGATVGTGICFITPSAAAAFVTSDHYKPYAVMNVLPKPSEAKYHYDNRTFYVYDSFAEFDAAVQGRQNDITKALNKLTPEEIKLLGIDPVTVRQ